MHAFSTYVLSPQTLGGKRVYIGTKIEEEKEDRQEQSNEEYWEELEEEEEEKKEERQITNGKERPWKTGAVGKSREEMDSSVPCIIATTPPLFRCAFKCDHSLAI